MAAMHTSRAAPRRSGYLAGVQIGDSKSRLQLGTRETTVMMATLALAVAEGSSRLRRIRRKPPSKTAWSAMQASV
jgi:hypothetical protein